MRREYNTDSILNLLKRAICFATNNKIHPSNISFEKDEENGLIAQFKLYHQYALHQNKSDENAAYGATREMAFYLFEQLNRFAQHDYPMETRISFQQKLNTFLFTHCAQPGHENFYPGLSESEATQIKNSVASPVEKNEHYHLTLFGLTAKTPAHTDPYAAIIPK